MFKTRQTQDTTAHCHQDHNAPTITNAMATASKQFFLEASVSHPRALLIAFLALAVNLVVVNF